jgi:hypothetical protein
MEKPADVMNAIEKKIKKIVWTPMASLVIANAVKSESPPVISQ